MKRTSLVSILTILALLSTTGLIMAQPPAARNFITYLSGDEEVPPVDTLAQGQAIFRLNKAGSELHYKLIVANIEDVTAAHIHCAPVGVNGPVGVTLFSGGPVTINGILAQGPLIAPDPGNACGWVDLADVISEIRSGDTYTNVHTVDFPSGEIRGQIRVAGPNNN